jgi:Na+-driven multidrug efflux pump
MDHLLQLGFLLAVWSIWPVVAFVRAKHFKRRSLSAALTSAVVALFVSTGFGILISDALSGNKDAREIRWLFPYVWIVVPLLWLLLVAIRTGSAGRGE